MTWEFSSANYTIVFPGPNEVCAHRCWTLILDEGGHSTGFWACVRCGEIVAAYEREGGRP